MAALTLRGAIARLAKLYGRAPRPPATHPFALVIWENCAYLVDDARRAAVFAKLKRTVALDPAKILATPLPALSREGQWGSVASSGEIRSRRERCSADSRELASPERTTSSCLPRVDGRSHPTPTGCACSSGSATERRAATISGCIARRRWR